MPVGMLFHILFSKGGQNMSEDIEFATFAKNAVSTNQDLLQSWISGEDTFKKTLAQFILFYQQEVTFNGH